MGRKKRGACGYLLPTEVHQFLLHSTCRTENPAEADFFFVPVYAACVMTKDRNTADETWSMQQNAAVVSGAAEMIVAFWAWGWNETLRTWRLSTAAW